MIKMEVNGIKILDKENRVVSVELPDILKEIQNGDRLLWSILYLYCNGPVGEIPLPEFEDQINESPMGLMINWTDLNTLAFDFYQIIDIVIIGSKNKEILKRYKTSKEMYEECDTVIEMVDSSFWVIFSKEEALLSRLRNKFQVVESMES